MNDAFASITNRIRAFIARSSIGSFSDLELVADFNALALDLHALQLDSVPVYQQFCSRKAEPRRVRSWHDIPALPISAFKQADVTSLASSQRIHTFYSSGTSSQEQSRHYHDDASLGLYEISLLAAFRLYVPLPSRARVLSLTPPRSTAPHSSLVYMLEALSRSFGEERSCFFGTVDRAGDWQIEMNRVLPALASCAGNDLPPLLVGTAFNFVHVLDHLHTTNQRLVLPPDSRVMETGGYKGRSRVLSRAELYQRIHEFLGVPPSRIFSEYGMCELSSQAYDNGEGQRGVFQFPPWARFRVVSPENGRVLPEGEPGILQVFDLANVRSVFAVQTEDLAVSTPNGFELLGRLPQAQPRGCSLMTA